MAESAELVHATCVAIGGVGVLIRGPSGAGKSDLALRLLYTPLPERFGIARLVSDDQVRLTVQNETLTAHTAPNLANKLEIRGTGIADLETVPSAHVRLIVDAAAKHEIPRMPVDGERWETLHSIRVRRIALAVLEPSAVARILQTVDELHR